LGAERSAGGPYRLVILRHGESEWNASDRFTGWVNVALSPAGEREAVRAGQLLARHGVRPGFVHTSVQRRAIRTADLALAQCDRDWIPARRSWRLNSNHYGTLQGRNKAAVRAEVGQEQFMRWRRSYDVAPPPLAADAEHSQFADARYAAVPPDIRPRTESLKDVTARLLPYWYDGIVPDLRSAQCVLVVSHGNTLRALIKHLEGMSAGEVARLNVPTATPLVYEFGPDLRPLGPGHALGTDIPGE
jgi:2,3-bisphosphoglycerate-dependent phosphoglycerate mutase